MKLDLKLITAIKLKLWGKKKEDDRAEGKNCGAIIQNSIDKGTDVAKILK